MTEIDGFELIAPQAYGERGVPHDQWRALRKLDRLHHCAPEGFDAFYPVVRHDQICEISKQPERFLNRLGIVVESQEQKRILEANQGVGQMRAILVMDPPEHRDYRKVAAPWFTPRAIDRIAPIAEESARALVDGLVERASGGEGECEFANEIAAAHPLRVLSTILGVSREMEPQLLRLTNALFAADDPDLQLQGEDRSQAVLALAMEFFQLFNGIIEDRRAKPRDDLATVLANANVNGAPMGMMETLGYYLITFTAGHDTTKNALAGGIHALAEHPGRVREAEAESGSGAGRGGGDPALGVARQLHEARRGEGHGIPRAEAPRRREPRALLRLGESRRVGLRGSLRIPHRPRSESAPRVRDRRALLPRRPPGSPVAARVAAGADPPVRHARARG